VKHALDNQLFTELCPKMVAAAAGIVEKIVREESAGSNH